MRGNSHVRFGGRAEETGGPKGLNRASVRPNHSSVALAIAEGAHPKAIQARMGHSSINVTLDRYGHLFPELDEALAAGFGERLTRRSGNGSNAVPSWCTDRSVRTSPAVPSDVEALAGCVERSPFTLGLPVLARYRLRGARRPSKVPSIVSTTRTAATRDPHRPNQTAPAGRSR